MSWKYLFWAFQTLSLLNTVAYCYILRHSALKRVNRELSKALVQSRLCAVDKFLDTNTWPVSQSLAYQNGDKVEFKVLTFDPSVGAIVSVGPYNDHGVVHLDEINTYENLQNTTFSMNPGHKSIGYVQRIRTDGVLVLCMSQLGMERLKECTNSVLSALKTSPTKSIPLGDHNSTTQINTIFPGMSKTVFKKSISYLYKRGLIVIGDEGIKLGTGEFDNPEENYVLSMRRLPTDLDVEQTKDFIFKLIEKENTTRVEVSKDIGTGKCNGFGLVYFKDRYSRDKARQHFHDEYHFVQVGKYYKQPAPREHSLFIGNLSPKVTEDLLKKILISYIDMNEVHSIYLPKNPDGKAMNKGFGFIDFKSAEAYDAAVNKLKGINIVGRELRLGKRKGVLLNYDETQSENENSSD